jgi:hypothetical protein
MTFTAPFKQHVCLFLSVFDMCLKMGEMMLFVMCDFLTCHVFHVFTYLLHSYGVCSFSKLDGSTLFFCTFFSYYTQLLHTDTPKSAQHCVGMSSACHSFSFIIYKISYQEASGSLLFVGRLHSNPHIATS